jgi:hypothetical protein
MISARRNVSGFTTLLAATCVGHHIFVIPELDKPTFSGGIARLCPSSSEQGCKHVPVPIPIVPISSLTSRIHNAKESSPTTYKINQIYKLAQ